MTAVTLQGLYKTFEHRRGTVAAIDGVDLEIRQDEFFVFLGPSGSGKTSTLRCIAGLEVPDGGSIRFGDQAVSNADERLFVPPNRRQIGMVFQNYALWPHKTVWQNVLYPLRQQRKNEAAQHARQASDALALVGLEDHAQRYPAELSGGQQQRVALARALVARPAVLLFDEPLSNLDASLRLRLREDIRRLHQSHPCTAIYVTHDQSEAVALADRIAVMHHGRIAQVGTPEELFLAPTSRFVAEFIGFDNFLAGHLAQSSDGVQFLAQDWSQPLHLAPLREQVPPNTTQVAFRSSSVRFHPAPPAPDTPNVFQAELVALSYNGSHYNGTARIGNIDIKGLLGLEVWGARARPALQTPVWIEIHPRSLVALAAA